MSNENISYSAFFNEVIKNSIKFDNIENTINMYDKVFTSKETTEEITNSDRMPKMTLAEFINKHNFA